MMWMSIGIGVASFAVLSRMTRRLRPAGVDVAAGALRVLGGAGLAALAGLALDGSPVASAVAAVAATALIVDVRLLGRAVASRVAGRHASTVTPFRNAT
jgi:hypothetical protein